MDFLDHTTTTTTTSATTNRQFINSILGFFFRVFQVFVGEKKRKDKVIIERHEHEQ